MNISKNLIDEMDSLNKQIKELENKLKGIKATILDAIPANNEVKIDDVILKHTQYDQEHFKLKEALEVLDKRMLKPYITVSTIDKLTIRKVA